MDPTPPPPSYDEVVKGGSEPSAPPPPQGYPAGPPPQEAAPYPIGQPEYPQGSAYGQPAYPPGRHSPYGQPAYPQQGQAGQPSAYGALPPSQAPGGGGYLQYNYAPVHVQGGGLNQAGGYQYNPGQQNVNPVTVTAGYQTTPLAYGNANMSIGSDQNHKRIFVMTCFIIVAVVVVMVIVMTVLF